jgi:hypothetical protein
MGANPEPDRDIPFNDGQGAIPKPYAGCIDGLAGMDLLEAQTLMMFVSLELPVTSRAR